MAPPEQPSAQAATGAGTTSQEHRLPTATQLVAGYAGGEVSPVEATRAALERIERHDPELNAFCLVDAEGALRAAEESEQRWARGNPRGLLDGVPTSIKDMFLTAGWPTLRGSRCISPDQNWQADSPVTARAREHGAVLLGKTTTPELAWKGVTDSPLTGLTRNPWNPALTPGGSSGGGSAAVAAGMGPVTIGTDGGGSVRIPASFCGLVGLKPTSGRIPMYPASPFGTLGHAGPLTWSVADMALMLDVMGMPDSRDPLGLPPVAVPFSEAYRREVSGLRVAFSPTLGYVDCQPEVAAIVEQAVAALATTGMEIEHTDPGFADPREPFDVLWSTGAAYLINRFPPELTDQVDPGLLRVWEHGKRYSAEDYLRANAAKAELGIHMGLFHERYDLLLTPTMPLAAFEAGHDVPPGSGMSDWPDWTPFTYPFNMTGQPAATVPAGTTSDGRPVGLQIVGARHADDLVLAACRALEQVRPWAVGIPTGTP